MHARAVFISTVAAATASLAPGQTTELHSSIAEAYDDYGISVAIDGTTVVVGARQADGPAGDDQGIVFVYEWDGATWAEQQRLYASGATPDDRLGFSVGISEDTIVAGARSDIGTGMGSGAAYVFVRNGTTWTEQARLVQSDGGMEDNFGERVAIDDDTIVVGATRATIGSEMWQGAAYVYTRTGGVWTEEAKLVASDGVADEYFGMSVGVSGDTAIVGTSRKTVDGKAWAGAAYVYVRDGGAWPEQAKLTAFDGAENDQFGSSVDVFSETALVGAPADDPDGSAYVLQRTGENWSHVTKLYASDVGPASGFGRSLDLHGQTAVVGARNSGALRASSGTAYVFDSTSGPWLQQTVLFDVDPPLGDSPEFGHAVAIHGEAAVVGDWEEHGPAGYRQGAAFVFERVIQCRRDFTHDGEIDGADLAILLTEWGGPGASADLTNDGVVDGADLAVVLAGWGPCP